MEKIQTKKNLINDILKISHRIAARGLTFGVGGGVSVKIPKTDKVLIKGYDPISGKFAACEDIHEKQISLVDIDGNQINNVKPCLETPLHLGVLKARRSIGAVIHAHAPYATAFGNLKPILEKTMDPSVRMHEFLKKAVFTPHSISGSEELAKLVAEPFKSENVTCVFMQNHGVTVGAEDIYQAYYILDMLEGRAKVFILSMLLLQAIPN